MKIELEYPFTELYSKAYLSISNKDYRARVTLLRSNGSGTFMQYARYLMCIKEGRVLNDNEEVDHVDKDKTNDTVGNLQILSIEDHKDKTRLEISGRTFKTLICTSCGKEFEREVRQLHKGHMRIFCSSHCSGKFYSASNNIGGKAKKITKENLILIKRLMEEGLSSYKIADIITSISRGTIDRYMRKIRNGSIDVEDSGT